MVIPDECSSRREWDSRDVGFNWNSNLAKNGRGSPLQAALRIECHLSEEGSNEVRTHPFQFEWIGRPCTEKPRASRRKEGRKGPATYACYSIQRGDMTDVPQDRTGVSFPEERDFASSFRVTKKGKKQWMSRPLNWRRVFHRMESNSTLLLCWARWRLSCFLHHPLAPTLSLSERAAMSESDVSQLGRQL